MSRPSPLPSLVLVLLVALAGCGPTGADPPPEVALQRGREPTGSPASAPVTAAPAAAAPHHPADDELCLLARDPGRAGDPTRWEPHLTAIEAALPAGADVRGALEGIARGQDATPDLLAAMDLVWDLVDERCDLPVIARQCRSLIMVGLADPLGWVARGAPPAAVETAFTLVLSNLADLRGRATDDALAASLDAHLALATALRDAFGSAAWGAAGFERLEPLEPQILAVAGADLALPLLGLEQLCGTR